MPAAGSADPVEIAAPPEDDPPPQPDDPVVVDAGDAAVPDEAAEEAPSKVAQLKAEAKSLTHLLGHRFKNPYCPSCQIAKLHVFPARKKAAAPVPEDEKRFGRSITADHVVLRDRQGA